MLMLDPGILEDGRPCIETFPSEAGMLPDGDFDVDAWEASKLFITASNHLSARQAWREIYRTARLMARQHGGYDHFGNVYLPDPISLPG